MNSACAGAEDGSTELHTVAVRENKQYRNRAKASLLRTRAERAGRAGPGPVEGGAVFTQEVEKVQDNTEIGIWMRIQK